MTDDMRGLLVSGRRETYVRAGNGTVTLQSPTGNRFTYRVSKSDGDRPVFFVSVLTGQDNVNDYTYLGTIFPDGFRTTRKSRIGTDSPSFVAFQWFARHFEDARVTVYHEGVCGRCGRKLTVPESIESGLGPVCSGRD